MPAANGRPAARSPLAPERAEQLLREAAEFKGESLWQDAWRRLRRNRGAWFALLYLAVFGSVSLLAPLLPLPSPSALDPRSEPGAPVLPWHANPRLVDPSEFGAAPTRSVGALLDDGWRHRTYVDFALPGEAPAAPARVAGSPELVALVERVSGRTPVVWARPGDTPGTRLERHVIVHHFSDASNSASKSASGEDANEAEDTGLRGRIAAALARGGAPTLPEGAALVDVHLRPGLWTDLSFLDRWLMGARGWLFGFWQTGPLLGTDSMGRDVLARIVWGSRISIQVSLIASLVSLVLGVGYGAFAGYLGGRIDNLMMRIVDVLYAIPFIFVVIFLITMLQGYRDVLDDWGIGRMTVFYLVVGGIYWLTMARVVRGQVLSLKNQEFVEAARVVGAGSVRIVLHHIVPNVLSIVIVYLTLTIPSVMLFEAFLSFLGLGVEVPRVSWGLLAVDSSEAISAIKTFWWLVLYPALAMAATLLALNILGDGLRDALDPKLRGKD
jgi:ABC-type dipeptide/oligopeptide/nickel transport system permease subunit